MRREVKQIVEERLPLPEMTDAQSDEEVLEVLLRQLGHATSLTDEMHAAWIEGVVNWRAKKAVDARNLAALRHLLETGGLEGLDEDVELPEDMREPTALINATLAQFEVPMDMEEGVVLKELLQEMDMDEDDVRDEARPPLTHGIDFHLVRWGCELRASS